MNHPRSRGERRAVRSAWIDYRKHIVNIWHLNLEGVEFPWGKYAKWNLNCGDKLCHSGKYFGPKRKRRNALHKAFSQAEIRFSNW